jgi:hypothetical protein
MERALVDVLGESYLAPETVLARGLERADVAYLALDARATPAAFFLVGQRGAPVRTAAGATPTIYLGLSAARSEARGTGRAGRLFERFIDDARAAHRGASPVLWATTATPAGFALIHRLFDAAEPREDGTHTEEGASVARQLAGALGRADGGHPFVLRNFASTRYAPAERERIARLARTKGFSLLDRLGIDEARGDRLLLLCRVPASPRRPPSTTPPTSSPPPA